MNKAVMSAYKILTFKMHNIGTNLNNHYGDDFPAGALWPGPVPNAVWVMHVSVENGKAFAFTFCCYSSAPFIMWHRAYMREFEYYLQN